jgi:hypothetical protein
MKAKLTALIATFLISTSLFVVIAQTPTTTGTYDTADTTDTVNTTNDADTTNEANVEVSSCEEITTAINNKINQYETDEATHVAMYQVLYLKIDAVSKKAKVLGYDTQKLEQNLAELEILMEDFEKYFDVFISKFQTTQKYVCDVTNDVQYAQSYIDTKRALRDVKDTAADINSLYQDQIRQNILGLEMVTDGQ